MAKIYHTSCCTVLVSQNHAPHDKNRVVYCEKPFKSPDNVIAYLGNYTHRVAISNHRILVHENDQVTFRYKDYRNDRASKNLTLQAHEFILRFLQHILPEGFSKIRYFGFLALRHLKENVDQCNKGCINYVS